MLIRSLNNQLDHRSITKRTNVRAKIWTGVLHDWKRALYQLSYQPLTAFWLSLSNVVITTLSNEHMFLRFPHGSVLLDILWREKFESCVFLNHLVPNFVPGAYSHLAERGCLFYFFLLAVIVHFNCFEGYLCLFISIANCWIF
jgi:hypothetical protein